MEIGSMAVLSYTKVEMIIEGELDSLSPYASRSDQEVREDIPG